MDLVQHSPASGAPGSPQTGILQANPSPEGSSSFDSLSEPCTDGNRPSEQSTPLKQRIRRSETSPPLSSYPEPEEEANSFSTSNGPMAASTSSENGADGAGGRIQQRLPTAHSFPCLSVLAANQSAEDSVLSVPPSLPAENGENSTFPPFPLPPLSHYSAEVENYSSSLSFFLVEADLATSPQQNVASSSRLSGGGGSRSPSPLPLAEIEGTSTSASGADKILSGSGNGGEASSSTSLGLLLDQMSAEGGESGSAGSMRSSSYDLPLSRSGHDSINSKHQQRGKRKSAWYQMLNPTYRSRCEDFKRIFKDLPFEERLIVDYSCALQRDILLQGRIYVTQNYLCFYANIFRWETLVQLRWKEVSSLTKEKTALVIPNAIQICTETEKHFFCSFGARDKTYVVLFRTWQQALLDQPLGNQELWKFVHSVYGGDLGFSSNEESGQTPSIDASGSRLPEEGGVLPVLALPAAGGGPGSNSHSPSPSLHSAQTSNDDELYFQLHHHRDFTSSRVQRHQNSTGTGGSDWRNNTTTGSGGSGEGASLSAAMPASASGGGETGSVDNDVPPPVPRRRLEHRVGSADQQQQQQHRASTVVDGISGIPHPPNRFTDSSDSEEDERLLGMSDEGGAGNSEPTHCPMTHEGMKEMLSVVVPTGVDDLFTLLFTNSSFLLDFLQNTRKSTDLQMGQWEEPAGGERCRTIAYNLPIPVNIGVKFTRTVETHTLLDISRPGGLYAVNTEVCNSGIPYADTFYVACHYCITRMSGGKSSRLVIHAQIKYRKSAWGIVKTFIEKNTWSGLEENFNQLKRNLHQAHPSPREAEDRSERRSELPGSAGGAGVGPVAVAGGAVSSLKHRQLRTDRRMPRRRAGVVSKNGDEVGGLDGAVGGIGGSNKRLYVGAETGQMVVRSSAKHSGRTGTNGGSGQGGSSSYVLYSVVVTFLILLVATNGFLFTKIWALEKLAEQLSKNSPSASAGYSACTAASNMADLRVLTAQPKSPEEWMKILRQQETLYRATESKWRSALTAASSYLKKTQESLDSLSVEQVEPDVELIRALLDKLRPPDPPAPVDGVEVVEEEDQQVNQQQQQQT